MRVLAAVWQRITRKPVLIGAAINAQFYVWWPDASELANVALLAWVAVVVDALTESRAGVAEKVETARYVGAVENQAVTQAGRTIAGKRT